MPISKDKMEQFKEGFARKETALTRLIDKFKKKKKPEEKKK